MKNFGIIAAGGTLLAIPLVWLVLIADEKPVVRPGQEEEYARVGKLLEASRQGPAPDTPPGPAPRLVCAEREFDFGEMNPYSQAQHTFWIENRGTDALIVRRGETSCTCTTIENGITRVSPGDKAPVTVTWRTNGTGRTFYQTATLHTNDRHEPVVVLRIRGTIRICLAANVDHLRFDRIVPQGSATGSFLIGSEVWDDFQIARLESTDPRIEVSSEKLPSNMLKNGLASAAEIRVCVRPQGERGNGRVRVFVRPPATWKDGGAQRTDRLAIQPDGTILVEVPVQYREMQRLSLYGTCIEDYPPHLSLGRVRMRETSEKSWTLYARIRGNRKVRNVMCHVQGIAGLVADVRLLDGNAASGQTAVIRLHFDDTVRPGTYDRFHAGLFRVATIGLEREEAIEIPIRLSVLGEDA